MSPGAGGPGRGPARGDAAEPVALAGTTVRSLLAEVEAHFLAAGIASARLDAEVLVGALVGGRSAIFAAPEAALDAEARRRLFAWTQRRCQRLPLAYVLGEKEFWSLPFEVDARVLVPRPETEHLVEVALARLAGRKHPRVLDVGTGSGAIAVALGHERPDAEVVAIDISAGSLDVARRNASRNGVAVDFVAGAFPSGLPHGVRFDLLVSNPPYIPTGDIAALPAEVRAEPLAALDGGPDGLAILRQLVAEGSNWLAPGGHLALEFGSGQARDVAALFSTHGFTSIEIARDLAGIERVIVATWSP